MRCPADGPDGSASGLFDVVGASDVVIASFPVFMFEAANTGLTPMVLPSKGPAKVGWCLCICVLVLAAVALCALLCRSVARKSQVRPPFVLIPYSHAQCAVCRVALEDGDAVRLLGCRHGFHMDCVDVALQDKGCCPVCKQDVHVMQAQRTSAIEAGVEDPLHFQAGVEVVYQPPAVPKRETPHPGSASGTVSSPAPSPGSFARALSTTLASRTHVMLQM